MTASSIADPTAADRAGRPSLLLSVAGHILEATLAGGALARQVFERIREPLGIDILLVHRMEADGTMELVADAGIAEELRDSAVRLKLGQVLCSRVAASREPLVADEAELRCIDSEPAACFLQQLGMRAYACHPLLGRQDTVLGTFAVARSDRRAFDADDVAFLQTVSHFLALAWDRQRTEEAQRASEEQQRSLLESITDGFFAVDRDWRITYVNQVAERTMGRDRQGLLGKRLWDEFPDAIDQACHEAFHRALAENTTVTCECHDAETNRWHEVRAYASPTGLSVYLRDVTESKRAEHELQEARERFESVQEWACMGSFDWDLQTNAVKWSPQLELLYGMAPGTFGGTYEAWAATVHPGDLARCEEDIRQMLVTGAGKTEWRVVRPDGSVQWLAGHAKVFRDDAGQPLRMVGIHIDITDRKRAEHELREADRKKDEFLATLAHELRNPLAPVRNGVQILRLSPTGGATALQALEMMERQVDHMVCLVDDLLDVSRISQGKIKLRRERLTLRSVLDSAIEASHPLIEAGQHELSVQLPYEPVHLDADPTRLAQVVSNLLNNAAKYTPPGGRIDVAARRDGDSVVIRVKDNGVGIARDMLPRVFELFTQVSKTVDRSKGGLGIGLSISRRLVEMHHGTIEAESPGLGRGATFTVRLPLALAKAQEEGSGDRGTTPPPDPGARRVLVVDDNADVADSLATMLRLFGYDTRTAYDGNDALQAAREFAPWLVFCDLGMPEMDGLEVARRIRSEPELAQTILVALTGWGTDEDRRQTIDAGFDRHLTKPVKVTAVQEVLAHYAAYRPRAGAVPELVKA